MEWVLNLRLNNGGVAVGLLVTQQAPAQTCTGPFDGAYGSERAAFPLPPSLPRRTGEGVTAKQGRVGAESGGGVGDRPSDRNLGCPVNSDYTYS